MPSYQLAYGKACNLLVELEHKTYRALKTMNLDLNTIDLLRKLSFSWKN